MKKLTLKELPLFMAIYSEGYPSMYLYRLATEEEKSKADRNTKFIHYKITEENRNENTPYNKQFYKIYNKVYGWGNVTYDVVDDATLKYMKKEFNLPENFDNSDVAQLFLAYIFLAKEIRAWKLDESSKVATSRKAALVHLAKYGIKFPDTTKKFLTYNVGIKNRILEYKTTKRAMTQIKESVQIGSLKKKAA